MRLLAAMLILAAAAGAQWRPFPNSAPVNRVLDDLDRVSSQAWVDHHERKHFENARRDLLRFQDNWSRGRFDRDRLDGAIDNLNHLAHADQLHPRDRQILARDLYLLRDLRASRGHGYRYYRGPGM